VKENNFQKKTKKLSSQNSEALKTNCDGYGQK
jgi:hypothetical protein